jgi:hypothetical protein
VKRYIDLVSFLAMAVVCSVITWGGSLYAQQTSPDAQQPPSQTQPMPDTQSPPSQAPSRQYPGQSGEQTQPSQSSPDPQAQPSDQAGTQTFLGTVVQQGDKYVLQSDNGKVYDIDHQDQVKKFEGKKVRIHGTLDPGGKMIHLQ